MRRRLLLLGVNSVKHTPAVINIRVRGASRLLSTPTSGLFENYNGLIQKGVLQPDSEQKNVVEALDSLFQQLADYDKNMELYHTELQEWKSKRHQLRQALLQEEAEKEAKREIEKKLAETKKSFTNSIYRWFKRIQERFVVNEVEKERQWQLHAYGLATIESLREKRLKRQAEPGSGRMVAHIKREKRLDQLVGPQPCLPPSPKGLYIYGNVGCGKTMLMDMFYNAAEGVVKHRRRLHFHSALLEVHDWMHKIWKQQEEEKVQQDVTQHNEDDLELLDPEPIAVNKAIKKWFDNERKFQEEYTHTNILDMVADNLLNESIDSAKGGASLLCFDEMQVVDVFTAVALAGIFTALIKKGAIIVSTSNRAPMDLNKAETNCHRRNV